MPITAFEKWNNKYAEEKAKWLRNQPHDLLLEYADLIPANSLILDAASGVGVDAFFLAQKKYTVIAMDVSYVGLHAAQERFRQHRLEYVGAVLDLSTAWFPPESFDAILNFYFLERATFRAYRRALKPGGLLFFETFQKDDKPRRHPQNYLDPGELVSAFADFEILKYVQTERTCANAKSGKRIEQLVARKRIA